MSLSPTEDRGKPCDATSAPCWREAKTIHRPEAPAEDRVLGLASRQEVRVGRRAGQQCGLPLNRSSRSIRLMQRISFSLVDTEGRRGIRSRSGLQSGRTGITGRARRETQPRAPAEVPMRLAGPLKCITRVAFRLIGLGVGSIGCE